MPEYTITRSDAYLAHYGVKGQKHGERRYQNPDGTLTPEGREHYGIGEGNRYQNADGTLTKTGVKETARINKFRDSDGYFARNAKKAGQRMGATQSEMYGAYKASKAAFVGTLLGGPLVGITAGLVSNHRYKKSGEAFAKTILG